MREIKTGDGKIMHLPDTEQRKRDTVCECHGRMGNDFWFLPVGSCLRDDKVCTNEQP